jgi:hypothetical protein
MPGNFRLLASGARTFVILAMIAAGLAPAPARAITDEIQVYTDDINDKGKFGLELHMNATPSGRATQDYPGDVPPRHGIRFTPEFSYGLSRNFEAGLYIPTARDAGGNLFAGGAKLRLKWLPVRGDEDTGGWYFGENFEISSLNRSFSESRYSSEIRTIIGYRAKDWLLGVNPILDFNLSPGFRQGGPDLVLAWKAAHAVAPGIALGAEYYSDVGKLSHPLPRDLQDRTLYLAMDFERKPWIFNVGIGRGLTGASDHWTLKAIFEVPID